MAQRTIIVWVARDDRPASSGYFDETNVYAIKPTPYGTAENPRGKRWSDGKSYRDHCTIPENKARRLGLKPGECKKARLVIES